MKPLYVLLFTFLLVSCRTIKDVPYFQNAAEFDGEGKGYLFDMTIKPKDKLNIFVHSSQPRAVLQFNFTEPRQLGVYSARQGGSTSSTTKAISTSPWWAPFTSKVSPSSRPTPS